MFLVLPLKIFTGYKLMSMKVLIGCNFATKWVVKNKVLRLQKRFKIVVNFACNKSCTLLRCYSFSEMLFSVVKDTESLLCHQKF